MDCVILAYMPPFRVPSDCWLEVREDLQSRLESPVLLLDLSLPFDELELVARSHWDICYQRAAKRVCLISLDCAEHALVLINYARLWRSIDLTNSNHPLCPGVPSLYISQPWDSADWAEFLSSSEIARVHDRWLLVADHSSFGFESLQSGNYGRVRKQVTELLWELRRLGVQADFALQDAKLADEKIENQMEFLWANYREIDSPIDIDAEDRVVLNQNGTSISKRFSDVFSMKGIVPLLVHKYLGAFEYESPMPPCLDSVLGYEPFVRRLNEMLPLEYRGGLGDIRTDSMGSASITLDEKGQVPWDKIWTSFCHLGLAGGPPHRGRLLEPVDRDEIDADKDLYQQVVTEIRRGIKLASGLDTVENETLGWVGVMCDDETMASWMLRAIIAENVIARREGHIVYVPAGPHFSIEKEIKNLVVTLAKTSYFFTRTRS